MNYNLDEKDWKIIKVLQDNGNFTTRQIAKKTLLPITTIHNRVKKLKEEKIIKKFTIDLDQKKINKNLLAYVMIYVNLQILKQKNKTQYDIADLISKFQFVKKVDITSGGPDLIAVVRVKDVEEFDNLLLGKLQRIEGVDKTQSYIVIHEK